MSWLTGAGGDEIPVLLGAQCDAHVLDLVHESDVACVQLEDVVAIAHVEVNVQRLGRQDV